jgi:hypothetical protein
LYYGLSLGNGPTIYNHGMGPTAVGARPVLRMAFSPAGYATLDFTTPSLRFAPQTTFSLSARAFATHAAYFGMARAPGAVTSRSATSYYQYEVTPTVSVASWGNRLTFSGGPVVKYTRMRTAPVLQASQSSAPLSFGFGTGTGFGQIGLRGDVNLTASARDRGTGLRINVGGTTYAPVWSVNRPLTEIYARASGFFRIPVPTSPTLHLRAGTERVLGDTPFHELTYLGGPEVFRGAPSRRFAGSAIAYAGAELRVPIARARAFNRTARFGVLGLVDAGRSDHAASPGTGWMGAFGGGLWLKPTDSRSTVSAGIVQGPLGARFYFRSDIGF